jgi:two-component system, cell cycle sensor histidine kinase and response regulator CckA
MTTQSTRDDDMPEPARPAATPQQPIDAGPLRAEFFRAVFEQSAIGVAIVQLDGRPVLANAALERFLGFTGAELRERTYQAITYPDDLALDAELAAQLVAGQVDSYVVEKRYCRKDATIVWGKLTVSLLRTQAGQPEFVLAMVEDIDERKRVEGALKASDARFRESFDASGVGMALVAPGGRIFEVNDALCQFLGRNAPDVIGRNFADFTHPDDEAETRRHIDRFYAGEVHSYQMEKRYLHADGQTIWGLLTVSLVRDSSGTPLHVVSQVQNITAQKVAREALRESELRYRRVLDTAYEGVWTIDRAAITDYVNDRMAELLGYRADEMLGRSMFEFMDDGARLDAARNFQRRQLGVMEKHEFRLQRKDGTELWTLMATSPILDDEGRFAGALAMVTDITEAKRAELALRESEARYRGLVELAPDGILVHCEGRIVFANAAAARLLGAATPDALIGRSGLDFLDPEYRQTVRERMDQRYPLGTVLPRLEERIVRLDGSTCDAELAGITITYGGRPARQVIIRDLTERRRAEASVRELEEQFRQSQKMEAVGQLAGGIAHDFNNLLTVINTYSELLLNEMDTASALREEVAEIRRAGMRAALLTRQLLAFSRKQILQPRILDLNTVVMELEPMLRRLIGEHIRIVTRQEGDLGPVKADPGQLEQVLINLVVNARDAMPDGGTLLIETANVHLDETLIARHPALKTGAYAMLSVSDTGFGMDEATRSRVFEPFFTTKEVGKGTGLGLSTVYGIVAQSNGYIWCDSEPGHGTTFKVYLPSAGDDEPRVTEPSRGATAPRGAEVLLLVEDEDQVRALARRILERYGYKILEARDGRDALRIAEGYEGRIDVLVTDVVMPELAGHQVFQSLLKARPTLRVLYMSGFTEYDIIRRGFVHAETAFLQKPFTATGLAQAVRAVLNGQDLGTRSSRVS